MNVDEWIGALRSGEYRQTTCRLHDPDGFCCLGVLADSQAVEWQDDKYAGMSCFETPTRLVTAEIPAALFHAWVGMSPEDQQHLICLNDSGESFDDIATEIKKMAYAS